MQTFLKAILFFLFLSGNAYAADYLALYNCLASYPGGHAAAEADPSGAAIWANETVSVLADEIPSGEVWSSIMANRDADWRPSGGVTSGGKPISDGDREDVRHSVLGGGRQELPIAPGDWGRVLLLDVFGNTSDVIGELQAKFTSDVQRCQTFGGLVEAGDVTEAINLHGPN